MEFEFDFDNPLDSLDAVPKPFQHFYEDNDGKFAVSETNRGAAEAFNAMSANLVKSRGTKKQASDESAARRKTINELHTAIKNAGFDGEDVTPEALGEFLTTLSTKAGTSADLQEKLKNQRAEMERTAQEAVSKEQGKNTKLRATVDKLLVDNTTRQAAKALGGDADLLLPFVQQQTKVVENEDGTFVVNVVDNQGEVRFNGTGGEMTIPELVESMKSDEKYGRLFDSDVPGGTGKQPPNNSRKPVGPGSRDTKNMSPAQKIAAGLSKRK